MGGPGCCWLLSVVPGCCRLLSVVPGCCWLLSVVVGCCTLLEVTLVPSPPPCTPPHRRNSSTRKESDLSPQGSPVHSLRRQRGSEGSTAAQTVDKEAGLPVPGVLADVKAHLLAPLGHGNAYPLGRNGNGDTYGAPGNGDGEADVFVYCAALTDELGDECAARGAPGGPVTEGEAVSPVVGTAGSPQEDAGAEDPATDTKEAQAGK